MLVLGSVVAITSTFERSKNPTCASKVLLVADTNQPRTNFEIMQDLNPAPARCRLGIITKSHKITGVFLRFSPQKT